MKQLFLKMYTYYIKLSHWYNNFTVCNTFTVSGRNLQN